MKNLGTVLQFAVCAFMRSPEARRGHYIVKRSILIGDDAAPETPTCYLAVYRPRTIENASGVFAVVLPITLCAGGDMIAMSTIYEWQNPSAITCPPYILEALSPSQSPTARAWRSRCAAIPWTYEMVIRRNRDGSRDISVMLTGQGGSTEVHTAKGVQWDQFDKVYGEISSRFFMTAIQPLRVTGGR